MQLFCENVWKKGIIRSRVSSNGVRKYGVEFLSHLHSHNLVHCDIRASNILFNHDEGTDYFVPKICDFGECSGMEVMKNASEIGGSLFLHPPEVRNKMSNYDGGVDIWGLGLVLSLNHPSAFLTLRQYGLVLPTDIQPKQELKEINKEQQDLLLDKNGKHLKDTIGNDFLQLLSLMLTFDPRKRPPAAQLLKHRVFANAQFDISHIPIGYAEELGLKVDYKSQLIVQPNIPVVQMARIPLDKPITKEQKKEMISIDLNTLAQQLGLQQGIQFEDLKLMISEGFQVLKTLGQGGFGRVYLVHHPELGIIAAKIMDNKDFDQREWDIAGILNKEACPFIIQNILARKFQTQTVILLEYANMGRKVFPLTTIRAILKQILEALRLMHSKGLIHRDIKGGNILLHSPPGTERVFLKLADFGLVKVQQNKNIDQSTQMTVVGTDQFMPPELLIGEEEGDEEVKADSKVDIWSLGMLIYYMMTLRFPFNPNAKSSINRFMINKKLDRPSQIVDDNLWDLIMKMLSFDRKNRISASDALKHPFFTSDQAKAEITDEQKQLAQSAL
ncbi:MAG: putative AGC family protein kinase, partial [Streblomastix strix]